MKIFLILSETPGAQVSSLAFFLLPSFLHHRSLICAIYLKTTTTKSMGFGDSQRCSIQVGHLIQLDLKEAISPKFSFLISRLELVAVTGCWGELEIMILNIKILHIVNIPKLMEATAVFVNSSNNGGGNNSNYMSSKLLSQQHQNVLSLCYMKRDFSGANLTMFWIVLIPICENYDVRTLSSFFLNSNLIPSV